MKKKLLCIVAVVLLSFSLPFLMLWNRADKPAHAALQTFTATSFVYPKCALKNTTNPFVRLSHLFIQRFKMTYIANLPSRLTINYAAPKQLIMIKNMLLEPSIALHKQVVNKVLTTLQCAAKRGIEHNHILAIIDYSLPSSEKRLWVFDLRNKALLFHTYVSHGIRSGALLSNYFSNKQNSKASSIGVYKTEETYYGREGLSLRLDGLDRGFNDNASNRYVVMHGGWYVEEAFIKKYGRAGRSWGCPALPLKLAKPIINTIKDDAFFVIYYPSDDWFLKSKFLNCNALSSSNPVEYLSQPMGLPDDHRSEILFVDLNHNNKHEENEPIVVLSAFDYQRMFQTTPPVDRMLRRRIEHMEYIALTPLEWTKITTSQSMRDHVLEQVRFVVPNVKLSRGYYKTEMKLVDLGRVKKAQYEGDDAMVSPDSKQFVLQFEGKPPRYLHATHQFIRWLGL